MSPSVPENLEKVLRQVSRFETKCGRPKRSVQLIAVSKTHPPEKIREAYQAGQRHFGENYLQEALDKIHALSDLDITWHYVGPIQSNKTRPIAENFHWVHSVDRERIAARLSDQRPSALPPLRILLQANISEESTKAGVSLRELPELATSCRGKKGIVLSGLMAIPAPNKYFEQQSKAFRRLKLARDQLQEQGFNHCRELSMGMSSDYEAAVAEGATMIRIGTDIFGPRNS